MRAITLAFASAFVAATPAAADYMVKEVGSFHVGGRTETLTGLPTKEVVFSPGAPPIKVDPNGEFEVEQMYVQYVKLAQPQGRVPLLLWHGGGLSGVTWETKPDGKPGWQQYLPQCRLRRLRLRRGRARPRLVGALSGDLQGRAVLPRQEGGLGAVPHRAELRGRRQARGVRGPAVPGRGVRPVRQAGRAALGDQRRRDAEGL